MKSARIEVRDKKGIYDAVAEELKRDIKDLGIEGVKEVEYIQVYLLTGKLDAKKTKKIAQEIFTDKVSQECNYTGGFVKKASKNTFIREITYNSGVMDPVDESAVKAIEDLGIKGVDSVRTARRYVVNGKINKKQVENITEKLLYNKTTQHVVTGKDEEKHLKAYKFKYVEVDLINACDRALKTISRQRQLYLSLLEMQSIKKYYRKIGRNPSDCELETIAQTWSEHCKHKTMMGGVKYNGKTVKNLLKETVVKVTKELNKPWCVSVFKDNAGIIEFDKKHNICFKVETHNHPSALEPYGGAETGIGGVIRDPMGTGRGSKPIINTDIFCFGIPDMARSQVPKGALHPKTVLKGVVSGVRDYGNRMGIPTVNGAVCFDERYTGNPLVFCGNVGIMPRKFSTKKVSPGDLIVIIGGKTGRDGIHGATFSSAELTHESETISSTAVQIGNPITEKKMVDTLLRARDRELYDSITDCGAGGFSSAVGEMGEETGADVHLDKAPLKYQGLEPWEIWISEAQERMVMAVKPKKLKALLKVFEEEDVEATVIGKFTKTKKLRLYYKGNIVSDLDMKFLHDGLPKIIRNAVFKKKRENKNDLSAKKKDYTKDLLKVLSSWNVCSKEWIIRQYDHEVQGGSVLKPLVGVEDDGPSDASVTRPLLNSKKGIVLSNGINPNYGDIDAYWMAASAIDEAMRQITSVGGNIERTAILDNFCWGNTEKPKQLGDMVRASQACYDIAKVYGTPFISGKDSLNNEFNTGKKTVAIPPTLLISAISIVDDVSKTVSSDVKQSDSLIYVVGKTYQEMGGSQYSVMNKRKGGMVPRVRPDVSMETMRSLSKAISKRFVLSCHDCSEGGLAVASAEMFFAGGFGAEILLSKVPKERSITRDDVLLFSESNSRFIVEVHPDNKKKFENIMKKTPFSVIGKTNESGRLVVRGLKQNITISVSLDKLKDNWKKPFRKLMHEEN